VRNPSTSSSEFEIVEETDENLIHLDRITPFIRSPRTRASGARELSLPTVYNWQKRSRSAVLPGYVASLRSATRQLHFPGNPGANSRNPGKLSLRVGRMQLVVEQRRRTARSGVANPTQAPENPLEFSIGYPSNRTKRSFAMEESPRSGCASTDARLLQVTLRRKKHRRMTASCRHRSWFQALSCPYTGACRTTLSRQRECCSPWASKSPCDRFSKRRNLPPSRGEAQRGLVPTLCSTDADSFSRSDVVSMKQHKFGILQRPDWCREHLYLIFCNDCKRHTAR